MKYTLTINLFTAILLTVFFTACDTTQEGSEGDISQMDSTQIIEEIDKIKKNVTDNRFDKENGTHFKRMGELNEASGNYTMAAANYMWALQSNPEIDGKKKIIHKLVEISKDRMRDKTTGNMFQLAFAEAYPDEPQSEEYRNSISGVDSLKELIGVFKDNMSNSEKGIQDPISKKVVDGSEIYATVLHDREDAPEVIQEAALILQSKNAVNKALSFYDWVLTNYPESEHAATALFMKAFTFENNIGDTAKARKYYEQFIEEYPNHTFTSDAKMLVKNLGKEFVPPEE